MPPLTSEIVTKVIANAMMKAIGIKAFTHSAKSSSEMISRILLTIWFLSWRIIGTCRQCINLLMEYNQRSVPENNANVRI